MIITCIVLFCLWWRVLRINSSGSSNMYVKTSLSSKTKEKKKSNTKTQIMLGLALLWKERDLAVVCSPYATAKWKSHHPNDSRLSPRRYDTYGASSVFFFFYPLLTLVDDKCFTGKTLVRACVHAFTPRVTAWSPPRWAAAPPCSRRQRHRRESQRRHAFQGRERSAPSARCP